VPPTTVFDDGFKPVTPDRVVVFDPVVPSVLVPPVTIFGVVFEPAAAGGVVGLDPVASCVLVRPVTPDGEVFDPTPLRDVERPVTEGEVLGNVRLPVAGVRPLVDGVVRLAVGERRGDGVVRPAVGERSVDGDERPTEDDLPVDGDERLVEGDDRLVDGLGLSGDTELGAEAPAEMNTNSPTTPQPRVRFMSALLSNRAT
jgi:hypothetical protein